MYKYEGKIGLESGLTRLEFKPTDGTFELHAGDALFLAGARAGVLARVKKGFEPLETPGPWEVDEGEGPALQFTRKEKWGRLILRAEPADGGVVILRLGLAWESEAEPPELEAMVPVQVPAGGLWPGRKTVKPWRVYVNGWQCWTPAGAVSARRPGDYLLPLFLPRRLKPMLLNTSTPVSSDRGAFYSDWFIGVADTLARDCLVAGFTGVAHTLSRVSVHAGRKPEQARLEALALMEGRRPGPDDVLWSEPLALVPGDLSPRALERYSDLLAAEQGVAEVRRMPAGWCTWYQYFTKVRQVDVVSNVERLENDYPGLGIEVIQVDDGYAPAPGDWLETGESFDEGMKALAEDIASRGKVPGVWVAPFTVTRSSKIFKEKPGWIQRNRKGRPVLAGINPLWGGRFYGLDVTDPEVLEHLREVFTTFAGYGYRFFKLDFMACGLLEGKKHDGSLTRAEAGRRALEVIRESVGKDAFIMAAGGPVLLGAGILDAQRLSGDVAPYWTARYQRFLRDRSTPGVRNSITNAMTRAFLCGRPFEGDPDCLMARAEQTRLTEAERRTLASTIAVFGGSFMVSDDVALWGQEEYALVAKSLPHSRGLARCPDLWEREVPRCLTCRMSDPTGEYVLAMVVNWNQHKGTVKTGLEELGLAAGRWHACEYWSGQYLGEVSSEVEVEGVEPHGCALLRLTRASDEPRLIGSSVNLSQGASEVVAADATPAGMELKLRSPLQAEAVILMSLPGAGDVGATTGGGGGVKVERLTTAVHRFTFFLDGEATLDLKFARPVG